MKIQGFLDHLLKSSSGSGSVLNADFGKGAISGGALGLLLGKNKTTRKLATYGGLAAIGVMAYRAYGDYKQQQQGGFAAGTAPQTVDRLPPPRGTAQPSYSQGVGRRRKGRRPHRRARA